MKYIWYNPDLDAYQEGSIRDYDSLIMRSVNRDRFDLVYEFNHATLNLVDKILKSLNTTRKLTLSGAYR